MSVYEYRTLRIERGAWPGVTRSVLGACAEQTRAAGGSVFALFTGVIGFASDEGVLMRAWPDADALVNHAARTLTVNGLVASRVHGLAPTVRPTDAIPPTEPGVYAHRWFWLRRQDEDVFVRLSENEIWPFFESDGCRIVGLWRSIESRPLAKLLLITRYASVAHWERTRPQALEPPPGADAQLYRQARDGVRRRAELTERSVVRLTRIIASDNH
jgi:hypothetical protein